MANEGMRAAAEDQAVQRPSVNWNINASTILAIITLAVGGIYKFASVEGRIETLDQRGQARIMITDKNFADQSAFNKTMIDLPFRMGSQEAKMSALNDRVDRLADAILASQEQIRKDISLLSTKVEVLGSKIDTLADKPKAGAFMRPPRM